MRALASLLGDDDMEAAINSELAHTGNMTFYLRNYYTRAVELLKRLDVE